MASPPPGAAVPWGPALGAQEGAGCSGQGNQWVWVPVGKSLEAWASPRREDHPGRCGTWAAWTPCPSRRQLAHLKRRESTPRGLPAWPTVGTPGPAGTQQLTRALLGSRSVSGNSQAPGGGPRPCSHGDTRAVVHARGQPGGFPSSEHSRPSVPCRSTVGSPQSCPSEALAGARTCGPGCPGHAPTGTC